MMMSVRTLIWSLAVVVTAVVGLSTTVGCSRTQEDEKAEKLSAKGYSEEYYAKLEKQGEKRPECLFYGTEKPLPEFPEAVG